MIESGKLVTATAISVEEVAAVELWMDMHKMEYKRQGLYVHFQRSDHDEWTATTTWELFKDEDITLFKLKWSK